MTEQRPARLRQAPQLPGYSVELPRKQSRAPAARPPRQPPRQLADTQSTSSSTTGASSAPPRTSTAAAAAASSFPGSSSHTSTQSATEVQQLPGGYTTTISEALPRPSSAASTQPAASSFPGSTSAGSSSGSFTPTTYNRLDLDPELQAFLDGHSSAPAPLLLQNVQSTPGADSHGSLQQGGDADILGTAGEHNGGGLPVGGSGDLAGEKAGTPAVEGDQKKTRAARGEGKRTLNQRGRRANPSRVEDLATQKKRYGERLKAMELNFDLILKELDAIGIMLVAHPAIHGPNGTTKIPHYVKVVSDSLKATHSAATFPSDSFVFSSRAIPFALDTTNESASQDLNNQQLYYAIIDLFEHLVRREQEGYVKGQMRVWENRRREVLELREKNEAALRAQQKAEADAKAAEANQSVMRTLLRSMGMSDQAIDEQLAKQGV
ncbi:hypothetical protein JCM5296_003488 [Sporobolomyces johnsonii]